jgi:hypothetical protein
MRHFAAIAAQVLFQPGKHCPRTVRQLRRDEGHHGAEDHWRNRQASGRRMPGAHDTMVARAMRPVLTQGFPCNAARPRAGKSP